MLHWWGSPRHRCIKIQNVDVIKKIIDSKEYEEKTNRWENMLKSDIYINESINVLSNLKTKKIQQNNILAKAG